MRRPFVTALVAVVSTLGMLAVLLGLGALKQSQAGITPPTSVPVGDVNGDGAVDIGDAIYLLEYLFHGGPEPVIAADIPGTCETCWPPHPEDMFSAAGEFPSGSTTTIDLVTVPAGVRLVVVELATSGSVELEYDGRFTPFGDEGEYGTGASARLTPGLVFQSGEAVRVKGSSGGTPDFYRVSGYWEPEEGRRSTVWPPPSENLIARPSVEVGEDEFVVPEGHWLVITRWDSAGDPIREVLDDGTTRIAIARRQGRSEIGIRFAPGSRISVDPDPGEPVTKIGFIGYLVPVE